MISALPRWRWPALVFLSLATVLALAQLPKLRAVFAPEELVPQLPEEARASRELLGPFGPAEEPLIVMVEGHDVLSQESLQYQHQLARHLGAEPWVARVDSLTTTALPHWAEPERATLDTLGDDEADERLAEAVGRAVATDPERFPAGLLTLSQRSGGRVLRVSPLVEGEHVSADDQAAIAALVRSSRAIRGRLIDGAGHLAIVSVVARSDLGSVEIESRVRETQRWLDSTHPPRGITASLAGLPQVRAAMVDELRSDQLWLVLVAVLGSVLVLVIGMRSVAGVLLPMGAAGMTSAMVIGAMAAIGEPINLLNNTIAPLLITICLGDAVHVVTRYREELAREPDRLVAARRTMRAMASACFLTSATTAVGFGSLVISDTTIVRHYAILAAAGVMLGYVVTLVFLPAALPSFRVGEAHAHVKSRALERVTSTLVRFGARRPVAMLAAALAVFAITTVVGERVRVDSALRDQLDARSPSRRSYDRLEQALSGVRRLEIGLAGSQSFAEPRALGELDALETWLRAQPRVRRVDGPPELAGELWSQLTFDEAARGEALATPARASALMEILALGAPDLEARYLRGHRARIEVRLEDGGEREIAELVTRIEHHLASLHGVQTAVGGEAAVSARGLARLITDLGGSVGLAMAVIFLLIGGLLRSVRLGLISILPNVMPLSITLAYMVARDIPLHAATTIVFSVSIGLAVDDTIHILSRYREEIAAGRTRLGAMVRSLRSSGRAALVSATTIWIGYAALMLASFVPVRLFGELSLVALGSSIACEIMVLPALLVLFGPRPPRPKEPVSHLRAATQAK